jgi:predicted alpha/beta superfamily hydrolase
MPELPEAQPQTTGPPPAANPDASVVGDLRLHEFRSRVFRNTRMLRVWLPPAYDEPGNQQRYPVLYLNDGQNLFDPATAFTGVEWQVDETADRLMREQKIAPLIFVGIDNASHDRIKEYMPYRSFHPPVFRPLGRRYPEFLLREVMPFIQQTYRVAKGPDNTGLGGSSLGGLIALYSAMAAPGIFGRLLVESPSLYFANRQVLRESRRFREWPSRIFLGVGTQEIGREDKNQEIVDDLRELGGILRRAGLGEDRLRIRIDDGATHSEAAWAARFPEALAFLFGQ